MACGGPDLDLYALGQLDSPQVIALEEHLLLCGYCRDELDLAVAFTRVVRETFARAI